MSLSTYRTSIRAAFRNGWNGASPLDVADQLYSAIRRGFELAWQEGSKSCGILATERTKEEQDKLNLLIGDNFQYVARLTTWIFEHSKANGYKFSDVLYRADEWVARYEYVTIVGREMACADVKEIWLRGSTTQSCCDCLRLHGRVYRNSIWHKYGIEPQSPTLACFGGHCGCKRVKTDQPVTKGRPPALRGPGGCGKGKRKELV